ncbi:MAG TPA: gliding motility-associated C-terminal domain-containing protein [Bacteroidales bacterium]
MHFTHIHKYNFKKTLIALLLVLLANPIILRTEVINQYYKIDSIHFGAANQLDTIFVTNPSLIKDSDIIILYQAKGVNWSYDSISPVGNNGFTGRFEFHVVHKKISNKILVRSISKDTIFNVSYSDTCNLQLVKVGTLNDITKNKTINNTVTCDPWDGSKGGIVAIVADTIILNANIDVSGKGFRGGNPTGDSKATCWENDSTNVSKGYLPKSKMAFGGFKGETIVSIDTNFTRGRTKLYTAGGGGNGYHAGGGGGACFYMGGNGGYEAPLCDTTPKTLGGEGGLGLGLGLLNYPDKNNPNPAIAVFGGGGGCSTQQFPYVASKGGNGGGIIIIMANAIKANGYSLKANGESVTGIATAGAGGGGGGGMILIDISTYLDKLNIEIKGGNGGSVNTVPPMPGPGGGGAGGFLRFNNSILSDSIILRKDEGNFGNPTLPFKNASSGTPGEMMGKLIMPVKDFLFNLMPADQEICEGVTPKLIKASTPKGANNKFRYVWRKSTNKILWDSIANQMTYQPGPLTVTTYYQRIVHPLDENNKVMSAYSDTSTILTIKVWPKIKNNFITLDTDSNVVCKNKQMPLLCRNIKDKEDTIKGGLGPGTYTYLWQDSISAWDSIAPGISNKFTYQPVLNDSAKFRRVVISGVCRSYSNTIKIDVLPTIKNNIISDTQWVALGANIDTIRGLAVNGGDNSYKYIWKKSFDKINWTTFDSTNNVHDIIWPKPTQTDTFYLYRLVISGKSNTCQDISNTITIHILDSIRNNRIKGNDTICSLTKPSDFIGSLPKGGDGVYYYKWEQSNNASFSSPQSFDVISDTIFNPGIIKHNTYFRRIALSGPGYCCKDTSNYIYIHTKPAITNNKILHSLDTTICYNQSLGLIMGTTPLFGDGPYKYFWEIKENGPFSVNNEKDTLKDFTPPSFKDTVQIRRKVISGICQSYSDTLIVKVLSLISNNISGTDTTICKGTDLEKFNALSPKGGDGTYKYLWQCHEENKPWKNCPGNYSVMQYNPPAIDSAIYFRRIVFSGLNDCCKDTSSIGLIKIFELPTSTLTQFDDSLCLGNKIDLSIRLTGKAPIKIKYTNGFETKEKEFNTTGLNTFSETPLIAGVYNYLITSVQDNNKCLAIDMSGTATKHVFEVPVVFAGIDTAVCGDSITLIATKTIGKGKWSLEVPATFYPADTANKVSIKTSAFGPQNVTWEANNGGCIDKKNIQVTFFQPPLDPSIGENQSGPYLFKTHLKAYLPQLGVGKWISPDNSIIIENNSDPETYVENLKFGKNQFIWVVTNGVCQATSDTLIVEATDLKIPEGFSPNGDKINDLFEIKGLENVKDANLTIINRWGKQIYNQPDYKNNWNGTQDGKELPSDTYYYILNVIGRTYKGYIVIRK